MVCKGFLCEVCSNSFTKEKEALKCEEKHKEEKRKQEEIIAKNKGMRFSKCVRVTKEELNDQFGSISFDVPKDCDLVILMGNRGTGYIPYRCLSPHQVYINDLRETFEKENFEVIYVVPVNSDTPFQIAYKNGYSEQRWSKEDVKGSEKEGEKK